MLPLLSHDGPVQDGIVDGKNQMAEGHSEQELQGANPIEEEEVKEQF